MRRSIFSIKFAAALLAIAFAGCAHKADDTAIITSIKAQMFSDAQLKNAEVQVTSSNGIVALTGAVSSDSARLDAYKIAAQTAGVSKVNDGLTVAPASAPAQPSLQQSASVDAADQPTSGALLAKLPKHRKDRAAREAEDSANWRESLAPPVDQPLAAAPPPPPDEPPPAQTVGAPPMPIPTAPSAPEQVTVPANTTIAIRMIDGVDSSVNKAREIFHASLDAPLLVQNELVVPAGADIYVRLTNVSSAGHLAGQSQLHLELVKLEFQGQSYPLTSGTYSLAGDSRGKDTAKKVGAGAVIGGLIGAIAGGGKGAAIGATLGGGAGGVYQASTNGKQVKIPSETKLNFQLEQPVTVTVISPIAASAASPSAAQ